MAINVDINDPLQRKDWVEEGLIESRASSKLDGMIGTTSDSVIHMTRLDTAKKGNSITFDYDGELEGVIVKGREVARGKGEEKRKFHSMLEVERYRIPVYNGDKFDANEIGARDLTNHSDSKRKLGRFFYKFRDQKIFDDLQGLTANLRTGVKMTPSHSIELGEGGLTYDDIFSMGYQLQTSVGLTGGTRMPLMPYTMYKGEEVWLLMADPLMIATLQLDPRFQENMRHADVRGDMNRVIKGAVGQIGNILVMDMGVFFGTQTISNGTSGEIIRTNHSKMNMSGFRNLDGNGLWSGQLGYNQAGALYSRGCIVGRNAIQYGMGDPVDYRYKSSEDFDIDSESVLVATFETQKTVLLGSNSPDNVSAKILDLDYGVIVVNCKVLDNNGKLIKASVGGSSGLVGYSPAPYAPPSDDGGASGQGGQPPSQGQGGASGQEGQQPPSQEQQPPSQGQEGASQLPPSQGSSDGGDGASAPSQASGGSTFVPQLQT